MGRNKTPADHGKAPEENMWVLNVDEKIRNKTWWWWWWIFFIKNPANPERPRQLMILWSTKNCDSIKVNDFRWHRRKPLVMRGAAHDDDGSCGKGEMEFNGMTAVWYYDGEKMIDPLLLEESDFTSSWEGDRGELKPHTGEDRRYFGGPEHYTVRVQRGALDLTFEMTPLEKRASDTYFKKNHYFRNYGYSIQKIYHMAMKGTMKNAGKDGMEHIRGSAYFQKVMVNAPSFPWYWGIMHSENGSYFDYFMPHIGFDLLRRTDSQGTVLNRLNTLDRSVSRSARFYDIEEDRTYKFDRIRLKKHYRNDLPVFRVKALDRESGSTMDFTLESYSRAFWRFEQRHFRIFKSILYYNEYPVMLKDFEMRLPHRKVKLEDLGYTVGNSEHAWGKLW